MSTSALDAVISSATTALLTLIAFWIRRLAKGMTQYRREHHFLMVTVRQNTETIKRILRHLELE